MRPVLRSCILHRESSVRSLTGSSRLLLSHHHSRNVYTRARNAHISPRSLNCSQKFSFCSSARTMSANAKATAQSGTQGTLSTEPAKLPSRDLELNGKHVRIVGLSVTHVADLFAAMGGEQHSGLFNFLFHGPFLTEESMREQLAKFEQQSGTDIAWYTIISRQTSKPVGFCALMRIDAKNRVIEVGSITYSPVLQRSVRDTFPRRIYILIVSTGKRNRDYVSTSQTCIRGSRLPPLRMEVRQHE